MFSCSPSRNCQSRLRPVKTSFRSTNFCVRTCGKAIKPYCFVFPQDVGCCCQSKFRLFFYDSICCAIRLLSDRHISSNVRPSGWMPYFCTQTSRRLCRGCFFSLACGPCAIFLPTFFCSSCLRGLARDFFLHALWPVIFSLVHFDHVVSVFVRTVLFHKVTPSDNFGKKCFLLVTTFAPLVFTCS